VAAGARGGLLLNLRHLPFGLAVGDLVGRSWPARLLGTHLMVDEVVAFARSRPGPARARRGYWLVGALMFVGWNVGTVLGALSGAAVPDPARFGVDAAFPAALLALAAARAAPGRRGAGGPARRGGGAGRHAVAAGRPSGAAGAGRPGRGGACASGAGKGVGR